MIKWICVLLFSGLFTTVGYSQNNSPGIAPFDIMLTSNQKLKSTQLKRGEAVILMYFSPECDHCKDLTKEILKNIKSLGTKQLIMVTYLPMGEVKKFADDFSLQKYPNIKVGTEGMTLIVQKYYNVRNFPFLALYDKSGKMVKMFREQTPAADIIKAMKGL